MYLARLGARLEIERHVAVDRRHVHGLPARRLRHGQLDLGEEGVALAGEARIWLHPDKHVDVAGPTVSRPGVAFTRDPDLLPMVDARRDLNVERPLLDHAALPPTLAARMLDVEIPPGI